MMRFSRFFDPQWPFSAVESWSKTAFNSHVGKQTHDRRFLISESCHLYETRELSRPSTISIIWGGASIFGNFSKKVDFCNNFYKNRILHSFLIRFCIFYLNFSNISVFWLNLGQFYLN
jgi:hypothetical protein